MIVRENEDYNSRLAYQLKITPEIFYLDVQSGVKLVRYIEGAETLNNATIQYESHRKGDYGFAYFAYVRSSF